MRKHRINQLYKILILLVLPILLSSGTNNMVNEHIRKKVEDLNAGLTVYIRGEKLYCEKLIPEYYSEQNFEPGWKNDKNVKELVQLLALAKEDGLQPEDYHVEVIRDILKSNQGPEEKADLDMLLSDAYMLYASHILNGKVDPETIDAEWHAMRKEGNPVKLLDSALSERAIYHSISALEPPHPSYKGLKSALKSYYEMAENGGWIAIPNGPTLKEGMTDSLRVPLIIARLLASEDLIDFPDDPYVYSEYLSSAMKKYQQRNGLEADGYVGKMTSESLNVPVEKRIDQIKVNMERLRWISHDLGENYIFVNIADFQLRVYEETEIVLQEKIIVGKPFRKTPVFSSDMTYIVLNPYWTIPPTILYNDVIPEVRKNKDYLATKNIRIINGKDRTEISPDSVDWQVRQNFPYILRQDPGPLNALGMVKFMFPNTYNVYIHDTPSKELFNRPERTFSSGCIRLENPEALLEYLSARHLDVDMQKIRKFIEEGKEKTLVLKKSIPIHILYLTSWIDKDMIHFRKDIYNRDQGVLDALRSSDNNR